MWHLLKPENGEKECAENGGKEKRGGHRIERRFQSTCPIKHSPDQVGDVDGAVPEKLARHQKEKGHARGRHARLADLGGEHLEDRAGKKRGASTSGV